MREETIDLKDYQERFNVLRNNGDYKGALALCDEVMNYGLAQDDIEAKKMAMLHSGVCFYYMGDLTSSLEAMERYKVFLDISSTDKDKLNYSNLLFVLYNATKNKEEAIRCLDETISLATKLNQLNMLSNAHSNYCHLLNEGGDANQALEHGIKAVEAANSFQEVATHELIIIRAELNLTMTYILLKRFEVAKNKIDRLENYPSLKKNNREMASVHDLKGYYYEGLGDFGMASSSFEMAYDLICQIGDIYFSKDIMESRIRVSESMSDFDKCYKLQKEHIQILETIRKEEADKIAKTLEVKHRIEEAKSYIYKDDLTLAYNRRYLYHYLNSQDKSDLIGCAIFDIDYFKQINDLHGHIVGDEVLKDLAKMLHKTLRKEDILIRYGGDEFIILFNELSCYKTLETMERIRKEVDERLWQISGLSIKMTISVGVTDNKLHQPKDVNQLIRYADAALYKAKELGRNRVEGAYEVVAGCMN